MAYTITNFKTKKEFKAAVASGHPVRVAQGMLGSVRNGTEWIEGPHAPEPHRWYAEVEVKDGIITKVIS